MAVEIITKEDLLQFKSELKSELIQDLKDIILSPSARKSKEWIKSSEACKMLGISPGTLQSLRIKKILPYSTIGSIHYYATADIQNLLNSRKNESK